jgi:putative transposase
VAVRVLRAASDRRPRARKGFTETDYASLLDAAHHQLGGPIALVWDNLRPVYYQRENRIRAHRTSSAAEPRTDDG